MENKIFKYGKDIVWSLPILFQYEPIWGAIKKLYKDFDIELPAVNGYGCCAMAWTGGRLPNLRGELNSKYLLKIYNYCNEMNITPSLTFTCTQLTKNDLKDKYSNYILDMALEVGAHFIVYSEDLYNHIKEKEPDAYMVASVIQSINKFQGDNQKNWSIENEIKHYNELCKKYDLVVVRPDFSLKYLENNISKLDDISKIEVLINQPCLQNCPKAAQHYKAVEDKRIEYNDKYFTCAKNQISPKKLWGNMQGHNRDLVERLVKLGINHLKLQGRGMNYSNDAFALMLFSQIFNVEGQNYYLFEELMCGKASREVEDFIQKLSL